ncbi:MAG: hypothetical protein H5T61_15195 [Thermoflexales bacterium]|nr:hypothetical protein [Thermoflexales bacterium]
MADPQAKAVFGGSQEEGEASVEPDGGRVLRAPSIEVIVGEYIGAVSNVIVIPAGRSSMNAQTSIRKPIPWFVVYIALLLSSFLTSALLWHLLIEDVLYYCSDSAPVLDFLPPFVHEPLAMTGDRFIASPIIVYVVWGVFVISSFLLPAIAIRSKKCWLQTGVLAAGGISLLTFIGEIIF